MNVPHPLEAEVAAYLAHLRVERGLSANTLAAYRRDLDRYAAHLAAAGVSEPRGITGEHVDAFSVALRTGSDDRTALADASVIRMLAAVRGLHRFWAAEGLAPADVTAGRPVPKPGRRLPKALSVDQVGDLIRAAGGDPTAARTPSQLCDAALLELLYGTGARVSEVVTLDVDDVTRAMADVTSGLRLVGKGDKERQVPLGSYARTALDAWLVQGRPGLAVRGAPTPALLLNDRGGRLSRQSAFNRIQAAAQRAGITAEVSPHTLRHSYATHLLDGGADIRVVQELLGHASVTTTQIYTLVTAEHLREVYLAAHPRAH